MQPLIRKPAASDRADGHAVLLQAGRGGGGEGAVHDGTQRLVGSEGFGEKVLLLGERVHLETETEVSHCCYLNFKSC